MVLKLYNSLSKTIETFTPVVPGKMRMYNCGPTVYSYQHIGNFRSFLFADLLRRVFIYKGYEVTQVMNITDVGHLTDDGDDGEDKLAVAARKEKKHPLEIAKFYTEIFLDDWKTLRLQEPEYRPRATEMIPEIISFIQELIQKGHAYVAGGNVYYDITTFIHYGKLSGNTIEQLTKNRVAHDANKKNPQDFVLWFSNSKFENHILQWDSPWGKGYPGWHIECSAMSARFLTHAFKDGAVTPAEFATIDIHTGGEDNRFPHHECEIAQSEGVFEKPYVRYWLHAKHLLVEGGKMSKSAGTVYYVFDLIKEGFSWRAIRYVLLSSHYRQPLNFTKDGLRSATQALARIDDTLRKLDVLRTQHEYNEQLASRIREMILSFETELDNDINISGALGALFEGIKYVNKALDEQTIGQTQAKEILETFFSLDAVLGFLPREILSQETIPQEVADLLAQRQIARDAKEWQKSDQLRDAIAQQGYDVRDSPAGQELRKR
jgi:cysteinyl-tRNA synthetase